MGYFNDANFAITILNHIFSMKKNNTDSNRSHFDQKQEYHSPTRFPKKEFQLIYREKEHLPYSEGYESIIFMKSKKCDRKEESSGVKIGSQIKKQQSESLNKVISKIEKQLNQQQSNRNKKEEETLRAGILKNKVSATVPIKRSTLEKPKQKIPGKATKNLKGQFLSCQTAKKYRNILSPSRHMKTKVSELTTASTLFAKTTQQNFKKDIKTKDKKKKKQNQDPFSPPLNFEEPQEYVFLENNFVGLTPRDVSALDQKLFSSRNYQLNQRTSPRQVITKRYQAEEPIYECQKTEHVFEDYLQYEDSSRSSKKNSVSSAQNQFMENNLSVVQMYFVSKVKIIQRWWRKIYTKQPLKVSEPELKVIETVEQVPKKEVFEIESEKSIHFQDKIIDNVEFFNGSPIKLIDEFSGALQNQTVELQAISSRENAAKTQREAHNNILEKLLLTKKISPEIYIDKKDVIEAKYYKQLEEIEDLKKILKTNSSKAAEMEKKTMEDLNLMEKGDVMIDTTLLDKIFGIECISPTGETDVLGQMPVLDGDIIQREKSTGCHYTSEQTVTNSLYKKEKPQEQYKEDFQEYGQGEDSPISVDECKETFEDVSTGEAMTNNLKELYDELKLREQVKTEVDKRAAIQMGIIVQNVPPELKNEFVSIDTSLNSIHRFILAFFKYYVFYYKFDFLRLINMPFGFNVEKKIKFLQGNTEQKCPEEDEDGVIYGLESVIPDDIFEQFYDKVYDMGNGEMSTAKMANFQFEKMHNKAIFDSFNEGLNFFRPYFLIDGPPFPWTSSEKALTFYFIAEENIQEVFEKTQFKVLKWSSTLCGIIVDKYTGSTPPLEEHQSADSICQKYKKAAHPLIAQTREDRMSKNQKLQIEEHNHEWGSFQNQKTSNNIEVSDVLFNFIIEEFCFQFLARNQDMRMEGEFNQESENESLSDFEIC